MVVRGVRIAGAFVSLFPPDVPRRVFFLVVVVFLKHAGVVLVYCTAFRFTRTATNVQRHMFFFGVAEPEVST